MYWKFGLRLSVMVAPVMAWPPMFCRRRRMRIVCPSEYDGWGEQISLKMQALGAGDWTTNEAHDCNGAIPAICPHAQLVIVVFGVAEGEIVK